MSAKRDERPVLTRDELNKKRDPIQANGSRGDGVGDNLAPLPRRPRRREPEPSLQQHLSHVPLTQQDA